MSDFYSDEEEKAAVPYKPGTVAVEESRVMSEVKAQVFMARQYPRDIVRATDRIMGECDRLKLAEKAMYSFPRGGTQVSGPSIRLAECIARAWGNIDAGIIEGERLNGESSMIAYAWDLETNVRMRKEFKVKHTRDTKQGRKNLTDERDIYEMTANQGSRRLRACMLALIPGDVVEAAVNRCEKTLVAKVGDLATVIPKMLSKFESIGVSREMIEKRLRHRIDATQAAEVVQLGNVFNSIQDGMAGIADFFDLPPVAPEDIVKAATVPTSAKVDSTAPELDLQAQAPEKASDKPKLADIKIALIDFLEDPELAVRMKDDIRLAMAKTPTDTIILGALLSKVKAAYSKDRK